MLRNILMTAAAAGALAAGSAIAAPGGGNGPNVDANVNAGTGGPSQNAIDSRANSMGPANASPRAMERASPNSVLNTNEAPTGTRIPTNPTVNTNVNSNARVNSQGPAHASPNGIAHANSRSVLATGAVTSDTLPGLTTGLTVQNSTGAEIGTVSQVVTGTDGTIRLVIVTSPTGETFRLVPNTLSISGDVVTTTTVGIGG